MTNDRGQMTKAAFAFFFFSLALPVVVAAGQLSFLVIDADSYLAHQAVQGMTLPSEVAVNSFSARELPENEAARHIIAASDVIVVDVMDEALTDYLLAQTDLAGKTVYALRGSRDDEGLKEKGIIFDPEINGYFEHLSRGNVQNMLYRVIHRHLDDSVDFSPARERPRRGLYHPDAPQVFLEAEDYLSWYSGRPGHDAARPRLALAFFSASLIEGQRDNVDVIVRRLEDAGFNLLPVFGRDQEVLEHFLLDPGREARVDLVLTFSLKFYSALNPAIARALRDVDVPVVSAVTLYGTEVDEWRRSPVGISSMEASWSMATPEISGLIEPTVLAGKRRERDPNTGKVLFVAETVAENLDRLIPRLHAWVTLQRKHNRDKKVAIVFYHHQQGKQNIGASYLNVFRSLETLLGTLKDKGYDIGGTTPDEETIKNLILSSARNVGSWAPGELDKMLLEGKVVRLPMHRYKEWFSRLPAAFREKVLAQWGAPETSRILTQGGDLLIPALRFGNVTVLPEPPRGWNDAPDKLYHDPTLYPHHQYVAAYLWLEHSVHADAMIHLGTHATYEWTPGKQAGLAPDDSPEVSITNIPNLYPYIVDNVGEGIQAKRRGRGVMVSHLTPPLRKAGLYREYAHLAELISDYERAVARGSETAGEKRRRVRALAEETGIWKDLLEHDVSDQHGHYHGHGAAHEHDHHHQDANDHDDIEQVHLLGHYLEEIRTNLMPYGMHTLGRSPAPEAAEETAAAIAEVNEQVEVGEAHRAIEASGAAELDALLRGLDGRYVPPGEGNDPIRNPGALPTGKNFYGFDPDKVPSPAAWALGVKAAEELIAGHLREHRRYPEKVAVVLWATETQRNEGLNESTLLWLMGMEPRRSKAGRVEGVRAVPGKRLNRPRIDVLISPSGLYRDLFPNMIELLDQAVQTAAAQTDIENLLARGSQRIRRTLVESGVDEKEADRLSRMRIFTEQAGSYGTGVAELASISGVWGADDELAEVYTLRTGFAYGQGAWGLPARALLQRNLAGVEVALHSRSSNVIGVLDNNDVFQHLGGLSLAVAKAAGRAPETLISLQRTPGEVGVEDIAKSLGREMRSRYLNPKWIEGMQREDYAGARAMAHFVEYLWGWQVTTPDKVDAAKWQQTFEVYVEDKYDLDMQAFFDTASPWASQSISGRMLEAVRKGYWQPDEAITRKLAVSYVTSIAQKGIACCDHTCNNPLLDQMVLNVVSVPGVVSPAFVERFRIAVEQAANKPLTERIQARETLRESLRPAARGQTREAQKGNPREQAESGRERDDATVEGFKMEKTDALDEKSELTSSGVQWFAALAVLVLIALAAVGAARRRT